MAQITHRVYDGKGNLLRTEQLTVDDTVVNRPKVEQQAKTALATLESNFTNWATLNTTQKDAANRLAQRVVAKLIRYVMNNLDSEGV